jgi:hypothetical protein
VCLPCASLGAAQSSCFFIGGLPQRVRGAREQERSVTHVCCVEGRQGVDLSPADVDAWWRSVQPFVGAQATLLSRGHSPDPIPPCVVDSQAFAPHVAAESMECLLLQKRCAWPRSCQRTPILVLSLDATPGWSCQGGATYAATLLPRWWCAPHDAIRSLWCKHAAGSSCQQQARQLCQPRNEPAAALARNHRHEFNLISMSTVRLSSL